MKKESFEHIVKNKLSNVEIEPPQVVWDTINHKLNKSSKRRSIIISSVSTIAASILLALSFNILFLDNKINNKPQVDIVESIKESIEVRMEPVQTTNIILDTIKKQVASIPRTTDIIEKDRIQASPITKHHICPINIKQETQKFIAYNNDKVIIDNNIKNEESKRTKPVLGLNISTRNKITNSQTSKINNIESLRSAGIESYIVSTNTKIPKSEITLHTNLSISLEYPIRKNLSIVTGLGYLGFSSKNSKEFYYDDINNILANKVIINKYNSDIKDIQHDFSYIEIPLTAKYSILDRKLAIYINGGIGLDFLIRNKSEIILENNESINNKAKDIKKIAYCGLGGIGISTRIFKSLSLKAEVQYRYYLNDISSNDAITLKNGIPTINFGLNYKL